MLPAAGDLVLDASVAAKWYLPDEDDTDIALAILGSSVRYEIVLFAPDYILVEVPSALTASTLGRNPRLTRQAGQAAIEEFLGHPIQTIASAELVLDAYDLVHRHGCAIYDALYLALAQRLGTPFIIADRRLFLRVGHLPDVVWIADYRTAGR